MDGWDGLRLFSGLPPVTVAQVLRQAMHLLARVMSPFSPSASFSPSNLTGTGALLPYKVLGEKGKERENYSRSCRRLSAALVDYESS